MNPRAKTRDSNQTSTKPLWIKFFFVYLYLFSTGCSAKFQSSRRMTTTTLHDNHNSHKSHYEPSALYNPQLKAVELDRGVIKDRYGIVVRVALSQIFLNIMRPDEQLTWPLRLPRILWEFSIMITAIIANRNTGPSSVLNLLMTIMLGATALVDIFIWAPVFAFMTEFETCTGGWFSERQCVPNYAKGYGRLIGVAQSAFGGLFYLAMALVAYTEYVSYRDDKDVAKQLYVLDTFEKSRNYNAKD